jgi:hypothetical protein
MVEGWQYRAASFRYRWHSRWQRPWQAVLVNGSPKSGTTWMVKLIASVPGYYPAGNFQGQISRYRNAPAGAVIHGHDPFSPELAAYLEEGRVKVILMVRDPRDQAVSRLYHIRRDEGHPWRRRLNEVNDSEGLMLCIRGAEGLPGAQEMIGLSQSWLGQGDRVLCLQYEQLTTAPLQQMERVCAYLAIPASRQLLQAIVDRNRFERLSVGRRIWQASRQPGQEDTASHFRKGIVGDWRNHFQDDHRRCFKEVAGELLITLGYEQDLAW